MNSSGRKTLILILISGLLLLLPSCRTGTLPSPTASETASPSRKKLFRIGVVQVVTHPLIDAVRDGFVQRMKELGYSEARFDFQNAQGEASNAAAIAQKFVAGGDDLIFTVGTTPSQAAAKATSEIPIIFGAVTDPVSAGLVKDPKKPGANLTGVSDLSPFKDQLSLLHRVAPTVKVIGMVYNPGEANSVFGVEATRKAAGELNMEVKTAPIGSSSEIYSAAKSLAPKVDAFYSGTDNTVVSGLESLVKVANENHKPLLAADPDSVKRGAVLTIGVDYRDVGIASANMANSVLSGTPPGEIPIQYAPGTVLAVNLKAAAIQQVTVPADLEQKAQILIKKE